MLKSSVIGPEGKTFNPNRLNKRSAPNSIIVAHKTEAVAKDLAK